MDKATLDLDPFVRTMKYFLNGFFRKILERSLQCQVVFFQQGFQLPENHHVLVLTQWSNTTFMNGQRTVRNHFVHINQIDIAQAFASVASPLRRVEREIMRSRFLVGYPCNRAHQSFAIMADFIAGSIQYHDKPVSLVHGSSYTLLQALVVLIGSYHHFVDYYFDVVVLIAVYLHAVSDFAHFSVYSHIEITFLTYLLEKFLIMSFTGTYQRSEQIDALTLVFFMNQIENLFFGIFHHFLAR